MMQAGAALYMSYMYMYAYVLVRTGYELRYRDNENPSTPTYPRSQEVSGLDMGVQYTTHPWCSIHVYMVGSQLPMGHLVSQDP